MRVADLVGVPPSAVAIAWTVARPDIASVILGPRTVDQLTDNLTGVGLSLAADLVDRLNTVSAPTNQPVTGLPITLPTTA